MTRNRLCAFGAAAVIGIAGAAGAGDATFELFPGQWAFFDCSADAQTAITFHPFSGQAYIWWRDVGFNSLGYVNTVNAISDDGTTVVGERTLADGMSHASVWTMDDLWQDLGGLPDDPGCDAFLSNAFGVSGDGSIVVGLGWDNCKGRAFRWTEATGMVELPQDGTNSARANTISADGTVIAGWDEHSSFGNRRPSLWFSDGSEIVHVDGAGEFYDITRDGSMAVGEMNTEAMYWTADDGFVSIGKVVNDPFFSARATGVSDDGSVIVGVSGDFFWGPFGGLLWTPDTGTIALEQYLIDAGATNIGDLWLEPTCISADGTTIMGGAFDPFTFEYTAFIATMPTDDCPPDFNGDGTVDSRDFVAFLNAFTAGDPSADYNGDGSVDSQDFTAFLNDFVAGC
jgi:hypothetical protein